MMFISYMLWDGCIAGLEKWRDTRVWLQDWRDNMGLHYRYKIDMQHWPQACDEEICV